MSKTRILLHVVFTTKYRKPCIILREKHRLINYFIAIIRNRNCKPIMINAMPEHVHILLDLRPSIALSDLVKSLKQSSSNWIKRENLFPDFEKWQEGYFAGSIGPDGVERCINYIKNQEKHHLGEDSQPEIKHLIELYNLEWFPDEWN